jgi:hypothetical protein
MARRAVGICLRLCPGCNALVLAKPLDPIDPLLSEPEACANVRRASRKRMPFTVSCTTCKARFLLGDDLFRRKVSGNIVTVKCRNCDAEISVDARDADTMPSHEQPRRAPLPPRPRPKEKMGLVVPPQPISDDARSIWDSEQTVSIGGKPASQEPEFVDFEEIPASSSDAPSLNALTHDATRVHPPRRNKPPDDFLVRPST